MFSSFFDFIIVVVNNLSCERQHRVFFVLYCVTKCRSAHRKKVNKFHSYTIKKKIIEEVGTLVHLFKFVFKTNLFKTKILFSYITYIGIIWSMRTFLASTIYSKRYQWIQMRFLNFGLHTLSEIFLGIILLNLEFFIPNQRNDRYIIFARWFIYMYMNYMLCRKDIHSWNTYCSIFIPHS